MAPTTPAPEIPVPDNEDASFVSKVRRGSAALGALIKTAPDPEDASLSAQARRGSAAIISVGDNIRRASAKFADFATEDVIGGGLAAEIPSNQVAPAPAAATPAPDTNNAAQTPSEKTKPLVKINLNEEKTSLFWMAVSTNFEMPLLRVP